MMGNHYGKRFRVPVKVKQGNISDSGSTAESEG